MQKRQGFENGRGVLDPKLPVDIGAMTQRRRIVEAMIDSCAAKTYAGTTISDIVSGASISRTTFYKRFADKRACFDAAVDHCVEVLEEVAASHSGADSPPQALREATAALLALMAAKPALTQFAVGEAVAVEPAVIERFGAIAIPALEGLWERAGGSTRRHADPRLALGRVQVLIFDQLTSGGAAELPSLLLEVLYLVLLPFAGHDEALRQSRLAAEPGSDKLGAPR